MAKKFFSFLALCVCVLTAGVCFVACQKAVNIQGSISFEFKDFTISDMGNMYFTWGILSGNYNETREETGIKVVYGPYKTKYKDNVQVEIYVPSEYNVNLTVREKEDKPFTTRVNVDDPYNRRFIITIPFAENIDYKFELEKPTAVINQVQLEFADDGLFTRSEEAVRDLLDHTNIWVDNKDFNTATNTAVGGFMPLVTGEGLTRQFGLAGKYINVDMTTENFTLYLQYDNNGRSIPFNEYTVKDIFHLGSRGADRVFVTEKNGQKVYALEFETDRLQSDNSIVLQNLYDLTYVRGVMRDEQTQSTALSDLYDGSDNVTINFTRVGWSNDGEDWQTSDLPYYKEYKQKLLIKYELSRITGNFNEDIESLLYQKIDFTKLRFLINGAPAKTQYESGDKPCFIVEIGAFDTPEQYGEEFSTMFNLDVDRTSVQLNASDSDFKQITLSSILGFWRGEESVVLSFIRGEEGTTDVSLLTTTNSSPMEFRVRNIAMYGSFKLEITLNGTKYTQEFVFGTDYLPKVAGDGQLAGAYLFDTLYDDANKNFAGNSNIHYHVRINGDENILVVEIDPHVLQSELLVELTEVKERDVEFEANGDMYRGAYRVTSRDYNYSDVNDTRTEVEFDSNMDYDIMYGSRFSIQVAIYSGTVLIGYYSINDGEFTCALEGFQNNNIGFYAYASQSGNTPDVTLSFTNNGRLHLEFEGFEANILITRVVVTMQSF